MTPTKTDERAKRIRLIHVARRDLAMAEDTYRQIVRQCTQEKKSSAAECTLHELQLVLDHMKRAGFKVRKGAPAARNGRRTLDTGPMPSKARALWLFLHQVGEVRDPSEAALEAFTRRQAGVDALQWVHRHERVIEPLKKWAERVLPAAIERRLQGLQERGLGHPWRSAAMLAGVVAPTRNPATFDALWSAWEYLNEIEQVLNERSKVPPSLEGSGQ